MGWGSVSKQGELEREKKLALNALFILQESERVEEG